MRDVRLYLRDALREYAVIQAFRPRRSEYARCYTGAAGGWAGGKLKGMRRASTRPSTAPAWHTAGITSPVAACRAATLAACCCTCAPQAGCCWSSLVSPTRRMQQTWPASIPGWIPGIPAAPSSSLAAAVAQSRHACCAHAVLRKRALPRTLSTSSTDAALGVTRQRHDRHASKSSAVAGDS